MDTRAVAASSRHQETAAATATNIYPRMGESPAGPSNAHRDSTDLGLVNLTDVASSEGRPDNTVYARQDEAIISEPDPFSQDLALQDRNSTSACRSNTTDTVTLYLNAIQIVAAQNLCLLDEGPSISEEDIKDKDKTSAYARGLVIFQLVWFAMRNITQLCLGQSPAQIELATLTYVLCALMAYAMFWNQPQGVERPIQHIVRASPIKRTRPVTDEDIHWLSFYSGSPFLERNFVPPFGMGSTGFDATKLPPSDLSLTCFTTFGGVLLMDDDVAGIIVGMIFRALYCLGWNHSFSSKMELWAWRASAIVITGSLVPFALSNALCSISALHYQADRVRPSTHSTHILSLYMLLVLYILCRGFMLVIMVRVLWL
ncbi:hypothetical protein CGCF415_v015029 [Colletotrichum fructicola]|nr:hypothetical protein CGCF415_v015029 [Colletotrichum fructicola]KAF4923512.1 hypothetical protein CGCF245_v014918 [Colletotrichum fructicola]